MLQCVVLCCDASKCMKFWVWCVVALCRVVFRVVLRALCCGVPVL